MTDDQKQAIHHEVNVIRRAKGGAPTVAERLYVKHVLETGSYFEASRRMGAKSPLRHSKAWSARASVRKLIAQAAEGMLSKNEVLAQLAEIATAQLGTYCELFCRSGEELRAYIRAYGEAGLLGPVKRIHFTKGFGSNPELHDRTTALIRLGLHIGLWNAQDSMDGFDPSKLTDDQLNQLTDALRKNKPMPRIAI